MNIAGIKVRVTNGRVRPVADEYWRLVLPGDCKAAGDEVRNARTNRWKRSKLPDGFVYTLFGRFGMHRRRETRRSK